VFICAECSKEIVFWDEAIDKTEAIVRDEFDCPSCGAKSGKIGSERAWLSKYDNSLNKIVKQAKQVPVLINYSLPNSAKRFEKKPDQQDLEILKKIEKELNPHWHPVDKIPKGDKTNEPIRLGTTHVHHFYTDRNLKALSSVYSRISSPYIRFLFTGFISGATKLNQLHLKNYVFGGGGCNPGPRKGVIYTPSIGLESAVTKLLIERLKTQIRAFKSYPTQSYPSTILSLSSASQLNGDVRLDGVLDYVFIDPPFGSNLMYSELSHTWESWLKVFTNNQSEAIENKTQGKSVDEYRRIMTDCFSYIFRLLKPGRWMTVEFSNTKAHVWNNIQAAITSAGFIIGNVSALDKKQGGLNAIIGNTAVKQDLVISAYKPNGGFEARFEKEAQTEEGVWDFVRTHLKYLPVSKRQGTLLQLIPERDPRILFDQMVAYYVRKGYPVPISSPEFQQGLAQRFIDRDGMYFLPEQAAEYDRVKMTSEQVVQASLFVSDEATAIQWLRQLLKNKPQTFADINPQFMQQLGGWSKNEAQLDLRELLNQNFLSYDGKGDVPEQIHAYLSTNWKELRNLPKTDPTLVSKAKDRWYVPDPNKSGDLEKLRERALLKEFEEYKQAKKKLKVFRLEAVRAGFKKAWQERDYTIIVKVAEVIPSNVLEEDPKLLMWYDQAVTRMGG
jgi:DNA-directed RNA polymerase subunit RPC12/RpoP